MDFSHGSEVENLLADAGDTGSISGLRRFPRSANELRPHAPAVKSVP